MNDRYRQTKRYCTRFNKRYVYVKIWAGGFRIGGRFIPLYDVANKTVIDMKGLTL